MGAPRDTRAPSSAPDLKEYIFFSTHVEKCDLGLVFFQCQGHKTREAVEFTK